MTAAVAERPAGTTYPYEELLRASSAEAVVREGWALGKYPPVALAPPIDWRFTGDASRSHNYHLHALDLIDPLLAADSAGRRDRGYLELAFAVAVDWARQHLDRPADQISPMAWYDMAVGLRAYRLAYVFDEARRRGLGSAEEIELLTRTMEAHRTALMGDADFAAHSNHGLYQACGQLAMARRLADMPGMDAAADQARERIARVVGAQFTGEGVHKEHSPGYHLRVLESLAGAEAAGLLDTPELQAIVRNARAALTWFVKPNGFILNFGDTDEGRVDPALIAGPAPMGMRAFKESGYFVVRSVGTYLAQTLAYHSRTHKQADDLSLVWCEDGRDILVDAGRYGYRGRTTTGSDLWRRGFWYDDPNRVFVESTHAHNTVEIDGLSYDRRAEKPYGSALLDADQTAEGLIWSVGEVDHGPLGRHRRFVVLLRARWLLIVDRIEPAEVGARRLFGLLPAKGRHYAQWLHFASDFEIEATGRAAFRASSAVGRTTVQVQSLIGGVAGSEVEKGQTSPRMQGWISPRDGVLTPAPAAAMETTSPGTALFATLLHIGEEAPQVEPAQVVENGDGLDLAWSAGGRPIQVWIRGLTSGKPSVRRSTAAGA